MITVKNLTKCYGDFKAVSDLSFEIEEGHVYGFLGPNGAGKSTTMNIITGCLSPTEGTVAIGGFDIFEEPAKAKKLIGYLPEIPPLYLNENASEYLKFVGEAKGLKGEELKLQIEKVIDQTGLGNMRNRQLSKLSKGYKQRVGIAQALLGNPKIIILDEPTIGLDPIQILEIRELIKNLGKEHTVIFSSHILSEVQEVCDKIIIISHGKLVAYEDTDKLENRLARSNEISFRVDCDENAAAMILENSGISAEGNLEITLKETENPGTEFVLQFGEEDPDELCRKMFFIFAKQDTAILEMSVKRANLEQIFLELTRTDAVDEEEESEEDEEYEDDSQDDIAEEKEEIE